MKDKIALIMIETVYDEVKQLLAQNEQDELEEVLSAYDKEIPIWDQMDEEMKVNAIEYVFHKRKEIELHSGCVSAWVQATAYFMMYHYIITRLIDVDGKPQLCGFFDDMDFFNTDLKEGYAKLDEGDKKLLKSYK